MAPEEEVARGREAQTVLNNSIFREAMVIMRGQMMEAFQKTKHDESEARDEIWRQMKIMDKFEDQLNAVMTTGKLGEKTLEMQKH